ncbi:uncharacterized protein G2W53_029278 [Senna tora]|uniref:Uncharacterized protein n=1 Tax=Senna tora TaxID=362788 RepID=A0A834TDQ9_9FABA|nr:uncharacterized protein G2W53_029278 [Senna tora]
MIGGEQGHQRWNHGGPVVMLSIVALVRM